MVRTRPDDRIGRRPAAVGGNAQGGQPEARRRDAANASLRMWSTVGARAVAYLAGWGRALLPEVPERTALHIVEEHFVCAGQLEWPGGVGRCHRALLPG